MIVHGLGYGLDALRDAREFRTGDVLAVDAHTLVEALYVRRGVQPRAVTGTAEDVVQHGAGTALAVAARDVDEAQLLLRVA